MPKVLWSFSAGKRAASSRPSSKVRVYEREDAPGTIWMERAWVTTESGSPVARPLKHGTTREGAELLARHTAIEREKLILAGRDDMGQPEDEGQPTVREILDAYHDSRVAMDWGARHAKEQERCRRFWIELLGADRIAAEVPEDEIERKVREASDRLGWTSTRTERRYLSYLRSASHWAYRKGRMVEHAIWTAIDLPAYHPNTTDRSYTLAETRKLMTPHPDVDWRVTLAANIIADSGRRITAVVSIWAGGKAHDEPSDLEVMTVELDGEPLERMWLRFRAETDKGKREAVRPVHEQTRALIEAALEHPVVAASGWLFPEGNLGRADPADKPISASSAIKALHRAEKVLGIERKKGRGYHGLKRRHVTEGYKVAGGDEAIVGDVTGNLDAGLLRNTYRQEDLERILRHVEGVGKVFRDDESGHESGHDKPSTEDQS